jgi:hypothetical protein
VLPDPSSRWFNPDLKSYSVDVSLDAVGEAELKPGMSVNVKIFVDRRRQVLCIPRQAITPIGGRHFVQVVRSGGIEERQVTIGKYNDFHVEIAAGLEEGNEVLLKPMVIDSEQEEDRRAETAGGAADTEDRKRWKDAPPAQEGRARRRPPSGGGSPSGASGKRGPRRREGGRP